MERPTADAFSAGAIQRAVLKATLQHPLTVLPAAVTVLSGVYMSLISFDPRSFAVGVGSALLAATSLVVNYFFRRETFAATYVARLRDRRRQVKQEAVESLRDRCAAAGFAAGEQAARELAVAYEKLRRHLAERADAGHLGALRFTVLAEDTHQEGVELLRTALESFRALRSVDPDKLRGELRDWEAELRRLETQRAGDAAAAARRDSLQRRLEGQRRRLALYGQRAQALEQLLAECEVLEAALETAYLDLLDLGRGESPGGPGQAAERLANAVGAARRVEERLRARDTEEWAGVYREYGDRAARKAPDDREEE